MGSGTVVNQVQTTYDGFGKLLEDIQSVQGAVVTGTTPKVVYARSDGDENRLQSVPDDTRLFLFSWKMGCLWKLPGAMALRNPTVLVRGYK